MWVSIQESLERNKANSFRKVRAMKLLTGTACCTRKAAVYPKITREPTKPDLQLIYVDERTRSAHICNEKMPTECTLIWRCLNR